MPTEQELAEAKAKADADVKAKADAEAKAKADADAAAAAGDEEVTIKKSELEKIKSDRDNYREGLLKKKADERDIDKKKDDTQAGAQIDEAKVKGIAKETVDAAISETHKSNEKRAKHIFLKRHGEYLDDVAWTDMISDFSLKRGKATIEDILDDLEDAVLLHKKRTGKLDEYLESERKRAKEEGRIEGSFQSGSDFGGVGDRKTEVKSELTPKGEEMAKKFKVDPKKIKEVSKEGQGSVITNP